MPFSVAGQRSQRVFSLHAPRRRGIRLSVCRELLAPAVAPTAVQSVTADLRPHTAAAVDRASPEARAIDVNSDLESHLVVENESGSRLSFSVDLAHLVWVDRKGWTPVRALSRGDVLSRADAGYMRILRVVHPNFAATDVRIDVAAARSRRSGGRADEESYNEAASQLAWEGFEQNDDSMSLLEGSVGAGLETLAAPSSDHEENSLSGPDILQWAAPPADGEEDSEPVMLNTAQHVSAQSSVADRH
jgi:hypothetical protein